jgi:copper homeostasis protein
MRNGECGRRPLLLEVIACSLEDAVEAERGGAGRLEVVRELDRDGLTPSVDLVRNILARVGVPVRVMIRERDGFAARDPGDVERLCALAEAMAELPVDGVVLGFLHEDGRLHADAIDRILYCAPGLRATLHRAFDHTPDPFETIDALARWPQIDRILTDGGPGSLPERVARLEAYARRTAPHLTILPGGGIDGDALSLIAASPLLAEAHVGRAARVPSTSTGAVSAERVSELLRQASR